MCGNETVLLRGKLSRGGVLCYAAVAGGVLVVLVLAFGGAVYIPASFSVVLAALLVDMLLSLLIFGTCWLDTMSCASASKQGVLLCKHAFSREKRHALHKIVVQAEDIAFGLVRLTIRAEGRKYVVVSDRSLFHALRVMREADSGGTQSGRAACG